MSKRTANLQSQKHADLLAWQSCKIAYPEAIECIEKCIRKAHPEQFDESDIEELERLIGLMKENMRPRTPVPFRS